MKTACKLNGFGLDGIDNQRSLDAWATSLDLDGSVSKWRPSPVPVTLPGVLLHGANYVLGIFASIAEQF